MLSLRSTSQALAAVAVLAAGGGAAVALAEPGRDHAEDDGTTTAETTTTGGTTTGSTTTGTTTTPRTSTRAPRIDEIEVDAVTGGRLRLRAETSGRVTSARFTYRGRTYQGRRTAGGDWARTVTARGGDRNDTVVTVRVRACNASRCTTRTGRDDA